MGEVKPDQIYCFACVNQVDPCTIDGVVCVCCSFCGQTERLEKAIDDCFIFIVAKAMAPSAIVHYTPHSYRFMPALDDENVSVARMRMIQSGRAKVAA